MHKVSEEMLRAATALASATFEFEKAVAEGNRFEARKALTAIREARNLASHSDAIMRQAFEAMPR